MENNCGVEVETGENALYGRQFFENNTAVETCGGGAIDPGSTESGAPNPIRVNVARKL